LAFVDDFQQWIWGKSVRNTERGRQASWESLWGTVRMCTVFGEALGITISTQNSPSETSSARIYDMQGRLLNDTSTPKGVYIKGDKKVIDKF
jgi:acid phosphatase (class A)